MAPLGEISAKRSVVKSKGVRGLDWKDALLHEAVSHNELIYTDERSSARITLHTGTIIDVEENSLIRIQQESDLESVDLEKGFLNTRLSGKPLRVRLGEQEIELSSQNAVVQISQDGGSGEIGVLSGEVELNNGESTQKINSSQVVVLEGEKLKVQKITFDLLSPKRGETIYLSENSTLINFRWTPSDQGELILEDSKGHSLPVTSDRANLTPGTYRWNVKSSSGTSLESPFHLIQVKAPKVLRPLSGEKISLAPGKNGSAKIALQWVQGEFPVELEWSMGDKEKSTTVEGASHVIDVEQSSSLRWRIRHVYEDPEIKKWSEWQLVDLKIPDPPKMPHIQTPDGVEFQFYKKENWSISLAWQNEGLSEIEIRSPDGELKTLMSNQQELSYLPRRSGDFEWRIRGRDEYERVTPWSEWQRFSVIDLSNEKIAEAQRIQIERPNQEVEFSWEGNEEESVFEISKDPKFKEDVLLRKVKGTSASVNIPEPGVYFWRSRRYLPDGKIEVNEPRKVIVEPNAAPLKPKPLPATEIPLQWKSVKRSFFDFFISSAYADGVEGVIKIDLPVHSNAKTYVVRILSSSGKTILTRELSSPEFRWENALPGEYQWQYAIKDFWGRQSEFSDPSNLTIRPPEVSRALLKRPIRAEEVSGEKIVFEWKIPKGVRGFTFEVSGDKDFTSLIKTLELSSSTDSTVMDSESIPEDGLYYWRVFSRFPDGRVKPSSTGRFTLIKKVPEVVEPKAQRTYPRRLLGGLWTPSMDTYSFEDNSKEGEIDGQNLIATEVYALNFKDKLFYAGNIKFAKGSVFEGEDYSTASLRLSGGYVFKTSFMAVGAGISLGYLRANTYSIEGSEVKGSSQSALQYGPQFLGFIPLDDQKTILVSGAYLMGEIQEIDLSADLLYPWNEYFLQGGVNLKSRTFDVNSGEQSSLGLRLGISKPF